MPTAQMPAMPPSTASPAPAAPPSTAPTPAPIMRPVRGVRCQRTSYTQAEPPRWAQSVSSTCAGSRPYSGVIASSMPTRRAQKRTSWGDGCAGRNSTRALPSWMWTAWKWSPGVLPRQQRLAAPVGLLGRGDAREAEEQPDGLRGHQLASHPAGELRTHAGRPEGVANAVRLDPVRATATRGTVLEGPFGTRPAGARPDRGQHVQQRGRDPGVAGRLVEIPHGFPYRRVGLSDGEGIEPRRATTAGRDGLSGGGGIGGGRECCRFAALGAEAPGGVLRYAEDGRSEKVAKMQCYRAPAASDARRPAAGPSGSRAARRAPGARSSRFAG